MRARLMTTHIPDMTNPNRVDIDVPAGGQPDRTGKSESAEALDGSTRTPVSRFATNGSQRSTPIPQHMEDAQPYQSELRQATTYLAGFRISNTVVVTDEQGQEHFAKIMVDASSDRYGSPQPRTLSASVGYNKYSFEVDGHRLAMGQVGMRHIRPDEQAAATAQFAEATAAWAVTKEGRRAWANTRLACNDLPDVGQPVVVWAGTPSEVRGTVHDITEREDYVILVIPGRPGTTLVPTDAIRRDFVHAIGDWS